jgi:hypothetical protein
MGKKDGGASKEAEQARKDEEERQARIRSGTQQINRIFDGGTWGSNALAAGAAFDPSATYYLEDGSTWSPTLPFAAAAPAAPGQPAGSGGMRVSPGARIGSGDPDKWGEAAGQSASTKRSPQGPAGPKTAADEFAEMLAGGKLFGGTETQGGFNDDFFNKRRQSYIDYAMPQLESQADDARKELTFSLARSGNLESSTRGQKLGTLQKLYDTQAQNVADQGLSYATQARNSVEDARSNLIATLNATGDAQGASQAALSRAAILSQPAAYSPLGQLFTDFTSGLGSQAAMERAEAASSGAYKARYNTGFFGNAGRVQVT